MGDAGYERKRSRPSRSSPLRRDDRDARPTSWTVRRRDPQEDLQILTICETLGRATSASMKLPVTIGRVSGSHVLVVDDDPTVVDVMTRYLTLEGFCVTGVGDGPAAVDAARAHLPDLVVLDLMLPGMEGLEVFRQLRMLGPVPVVMLSALDEEEDKLTGLDLGADDYVTKPFSPREVTARVKAVLNRTRTPAGPLLRGGPVLQAGSLEVDVAAREARIDSTPLVLTSRELDLLIFLMRNPRVAFRREELMEAVWGWAYGDTSTITVHIRRLREKIEPDPSRPVRIFTVWGVGYRFEP